STVIVATARAVIRKTCPSLTVFSSQWRDPGRPASDSACHVGDVSARARYTRDASPAHRVVNRPRVVNSRRSSCGRSTRSTRIVQGCCHVNSRESFQLRRGSVTGWPETFSVYAAWVAVRSLQGQRVVLNDIVVELDAVAATECLVRSPAGLRP